MIFVTVSTGHFDPLIQACDALRAQYDFFGQIGSGKYVPGFAHERTLEREKLRQYMDKAELVISHAGTGMLTLLYELRKPTIVVPKQIRYGESNDGQVDLAKKWAELNMALLVMDVANVGAAIVRSRQHSFQFPKFPSLGQELGF